MVIDILEIIFVSDEKTKTPIEFSLLDLQIIQL